MLWSKNFNLYLKTSNNLIISSTDVAFRISPTPYEKPKSLDFGRVWWQG